MELVPKEPTTSNSHAFRLLMYLAISVASLLKVFKSRVGRLRWVEGWGSAPDLGVIAIVNDLPRVRD